MAAEMFSHENASGFTIPTHLPYRDITPHVTRHHTCGRVQCQLQFCTVNGPELVTGGHKRSRTTFTGVIVAQTHKTLRHTV
jgi:hypothetical protein